MTSEKKYHKTPAGGDYSEIVFLDDHMNVVDSTVATRCVIRECKLDGTLLKETWGYPNHPTKHLQQVTL